LPREVVITDSDIREAVSQSVDTLIESIKEVLETTPPEVISDVMQRGIHLIGGGALIKGLAENYYRVQQKYPCISQATR